MICSTCTAESSSSEQSGRDQSFLQNGGVCEPQAAIGSSYGFALEGARRESNATCSEGRQRGRSYRSDGGGNGCDFTRCVARGALFLLMHGNDVTISKGTNISAFVQGDTTMDESKFQRQLVVSK